MMRRLIDTLVSKEHRFAVVVIVIAWLGVLTVGLLSPTPMIGDEVTHFFMLKTQSQVLPTPCFDAPIPGGLGGEAVEMRHYPHAFLWHYIGGILYRLWPSTAITQIYQSLFLLQLLVVLLLLCKTVIQLDRASTNLVLLSVASLPMVLIFSVAYYLDIPATAQVVTACFFLFQKKWVKGALFMALALALKENMMLFLPSYMILLVYHLKSRGKYRVVLAVTVSLAIILMGCWIVAFAIRSCAHGSYYPADMLMVLKNRAYLKLSALYPVSAGQVESMARADSHVKLVTSLYAPSVIANHPGDLRIPANWLTYAGGLFWLLVVGGLAGLAISFQQRKVSSQTGIFLNSLWFAGASYMLLVAAFGVPEARFFIPGVVCCCIPLSAYVMRFKRIKLVLVLFATVAALQSGAVLAKTFSLRHVSSGVKEAIEMLEREPPVPNKIFMYPEGNYRLFPCAHTWYLGYELKSFWKADNDERLGILERNGVGAIVVKKHLVGQIDEEMNNLGVYPDFFIQEIDSDGRFEKVLDNDAVSIYRLHPAHKKNQ